MNNRSPISEKVNHCISFRFACCHHELFWWEIIKECLNEFLWLGFLDFLTILQSCATEIKRLKVAAVKNEKSCNVVCVRCDIWISEITVCTFERGIPCFRVEVRELNEELEFFIESVKCICRLNHFICFLVKLWIQFQKSWEGAGIFRFEKLHSEL